MGVAPGLLRLEYGVVNSWENMIYRDTPIQRKLMAVILLTTAMALVVSCVGFISYEVYTIHNNMARALDTRAEFIAANIRTSQGKENQAAATEVLDALGKDPRMVAGAVYDRTGHLYARYPTDAPDNFFPAAPVASGHFFDRSGLSTFYPVVKDGQTLATIYLKSNLTALTDRIPGYIGLSVAVLCVALLATYLLSRVLQRQILLPIESLVKTAREISDHADYSVRAVKYKNDELGLLTDTFNQMVTHIHEQSRSLQQLAAIVQSTNDAVVSRTLDGKVISWNTGAERLFGYTREEAIGQSLAVLVPPERAHEEQEILARISQGLSMDNFETVRVRKDGTLVEIATTISPIKDEKGRVTGISAIGHSITERKQAEDKIRLLNLELEQRVVSRTAESQTSKLVAR